MLIFASIFAAALFDVAGSQSVSWSCDKCTRRHSSWDLKLSVCIEDSYFEAKSKTNPCGVTDSADCPLPIDPRYAYDDSFARNTMYPLALAANTEKPEACLSSISHDIEVFKQITVADDGIFGTISATIALWRNHNVIMVAFRTSNSVVQLAEQYIGTLISKTEVEGGGKVSSYYEKAFRKIWSAGMEKEITTLIDKNPGYEIYMSGVSMGAVLTVIAAHVFVAKGIAKPDVIKLVTFGEPRVYDREFSRVHDKTFPYTYRVVFRDDIVPHLCPKGLLGYYHHRYEVWYEDRVGAADKYKVCLSPEDCQCSNSKAAIGYLNFDTHTHYFGFSQFLLQNNGCNFTASRVSFIF